VGLRPIAGTLVQVHIERRDVLDATSPLAGGILATFAPQGADEVGVGLGWSDVRMNELWVTGSLQTWNQDDSGVSPLADGTGQQTGARAGVGWRPHCGANAWCLAPSWRMAAGSGGMFHAVGGTLSTPIPDPVSLSVHGFLVPRRTTYQRWTTAAVAGFNADVHASRYWGLGLGGEVGYDVIADIDVRGWAVLRLAL